MTPKELFQKSASAQFKTVMDSDEMQLAIGIALAELCAGKDIGKRELRGAGFVLAILTHLHLKEEPHKVSLASPLNHDFDKPQPPKVEKR